MHRINTAYFYKLAQQLMPLKSLVPQAKLYFENYVLINTAQEGLRYFLQNPLIPPMTSYGTGRELLTALEKITTEPYEESREIQWHEPAELSEILGRFEISLQSDFGTRDTFIITPKGAYSTTLLAESGDAVVSDPAHALVPTIKQDLHDGCRCLAFELPTAAAFHLFRAIEAFVCGYGEFVRKKPFTEKERRNGLGGYANFLKERSLAVDERIITTIEQVCKLHRNPTMHPEMHLSNTEIKATLGIVVSAIETVAIDWNRRKNTPDIALIDVLPDDSKVQNLLLDGDGNEPGEQQTEIRSGDDADSLGFKAGVAEAPRNGRAKNQDRKEAGA